MCSHFRPAISGASDGASSGAFLIELARVLKDYPREFTHEIVWFDGEEAFCKSWTECGKPDSPDNTYGSRYYVQAAQKANAIASIRAMILLDMIGAKHLKIDKETGYSAPWLTEIVWAQEEPRNMGAWFYVAPRLAPLVPPGASLEYVGRPDRASPAEGYPDAHSAEQARIVQEALGENRQ